MTATTNTLKRIALKTFNNGIIGWEISSEGEDTADVFKALKQLKAFAIEQSKTQEKAPKKKTARQPIVERASP